MEATQEIKNCLIKSSNSTQPLQQNTPSPFHFIVHLSGIENCVLLNTDTTLIESRRRLLCSLKTASFHRSSRGYTGSLKTEGRANAYSLTSFRRLCRTKHPPPHFIFTYALSTVRQTISFGSDDPNYR